MKHAHDTLIECEDLWEEREEVLQDTFWATIKNVINDMFRSTEEQNKRTICFMTIRLQKKEFKAVKGKLEERRQEEQDAGKR